MAKSTHLVSQHLENLSSNVLEEYQDLIKEYVKRRQGIYSLYRKGKLYYVGLASNLRSRLKQHLRDRHRGAWDRFSIYLTIGSDHLRELESLVLRITQPKGNEIKGKFAKSEDLRRRFRRDIKRHHNEVLEGIFRGAAKVEKRDRRPSEGRTPVLAPYLSKVKSLRARHKGRVLKATILKDGRIRFAGKIYTSPSVAGAAACSRLTCNGWTFWTYERAPGDWVQLDTLRK